jgi:signal transduction histidine kinase
MPSPRRRYWCVLAALAAAAIAPAMAETAPSPDRGGLDRMLHLLSPRLRELDEHSARIQAELPRLPQNPGEQHAESIGWHSQRGSAEQQSWVQVDLGAVKRFDSIVIIPASSGSGPAGGPGFGFPARFRVELSNKKGFTAPTVVADHTGADFPNPGASPVVISAAGLHGRFVRIVATKRWWSGMYYLCAIGEVMVFRGPINLAAGAPTRASDSNESAPTWGVANLTDGQSFLGPPLEPEISPSNGYLSFIENQPDVSKWVQVDLGAELPIEEIRIYPARPQDFADRSGFGFPPRFKLEAASDPAFEGAVTLLDYTARDFANPAENPVCVNAHGLRARYVRMTATRLWQRGPKSFVFALAEMEVFSGRKNVAYRKPVESLDSVGGRPSWRNEALTDGYNSRYRITDWPRWLRGLARRQELERELTSLADARREMVSERLGGALRYGIGIAVAAGLLLIAGIYYSRMRQRHEIEQWRARVSCDLHDEVGTNLAGIALLSQLALQQSSSEMHSSLDEIQRIARQTAGGMRDLVWLLNPKTSTTGNLVARMREMADTLLRDVRHEFKADTSEQTQQMPLEAKRQLFLFYKEALNNVARHANANEVEISLTQRDSWLSLRICDNGRGFDPQQTSAGLGLQSLRERARSLGGKLETKSAPGEGTTITLETRVT